MPHKQQPLVQKAAGGELNYSNRINRFRAKCGERSAAVPPTRLGALADTGRREYTALEGPAASTLP